jgi:hypothetical protein
MRAAHTPGLPRAGRRSGDLAETRFVDMPEMVQDGWGSLATMLGWSVRTVQRRRMELLRAGVVFYRFKGRPKRRTISFFPSLVKVWVIKKTQRNGGRL